MATIVGYLRGWVARYARDRCGGVAGGFRGDFYQCLVRHADALFKLTDAVLCAEGPVQSLVDVSLAAEHQCGHLALYGGLNCGRSTSLVLRVRLATSNSYERVAAGCTRRPPPSE
ncbi:transposase [Micromonospora sp. LZ34]